MGTEWLAPLAGQRWMRSAADAVLTRYARQRTLYLDHLDVAAVQLRTLRSLVHQARNTRFGREHRFDRIQTLADYRQRVPLRDYEAFWTGYWKEVYPAIDHQTWPGKIPYYALSSGTTSGTTKYIPVSREMLSSNRKAAFTNLALFKFLYPQAKIFQGRVFFLGGSTELRRQADGSFAGDLSGIAAREVLGLLRAYVYPPLSVSLLSDWERKIEILAQESAQLSITALSGVPSWMLILFDRLKRVTGKSTIAEIWPNFRLLIHGGTRFDPYRSLFRKEIGSEAVRFLDTYPCSEGYVATEDPRYDLLRVIPDHGIFFEFVPVDELQSDRPTRHYLGEIEVGVQYAVVLTTCAGLWSYIVGDTVCFERRHPPLLRFTGRTKFFLSAFGEHLILEEVEKALAEAAAQTGANYVDFHVGPIFPSDPKQPGHHRYLIEFVEPPSDSQRFVELLDAALCRLNEDYAAHRGGNISMLPPEVVPVRKGGFADWMKSRGKFGGQNKVPRMDNTGQMTSELSQWLGQHDPSRFA